MIAITKRQILNKSCSHSSRGCVAQFFLSSSAARIAFSVDLLFCQVRLVFCLCQWSHHSVFSEDFSCKIAEQVSNRNQTH